MYEKTSEATNDQFLSALKAQLDLFAGSAPLEDSDMQIKAFAAEVTPLLSPTMIASLVEAVAVGILMKQMTNVVGGIFLAGIHLGKKAECACQEARELERMT